MRQLPKNDNFWIGFLVGAVVPVLGYLMITELFAILTNYGIMDETNVFTGGKRIRTTLLLSIACNIIPVQFLNSRKYHYAIQGLVTSTFVYVAFWLYKYYAFLMHNF